MWPDACSHDSGERALGIETQRVKRAVQKKFPISLQKILPVAMRTGVLTACHSTTTVEASTSRDPVVAPAGAVLRVRLNRALDSRRSRPGDRFVGVLDSEVVAGTREVLPKGATVEGNVVATREPSQQVVAVILDWVERDGQKLPLTTTVVTRTETRPQKRESALLLDLLNDGTGPSGGAGYGVEDTTGKHVIMPADSIVGFTWKRTFDQEMRTRRKLRRDERG